MLLVFCLKSLLLQLVYYERQRGELEMGKTECANAELFTEIFFYFLTTPFLLGQGRNLILVFFCS